MALLSVDTRKQYFKDLKLGTYNKANIKKFQAKYMWRTSDVDGIWGPNSDNTLRTVWNVWKYTKNFDAKEFRCECGGRYCCGFPSYMKPNALKNIQAIRDHWNKPIIVTCGMRDKTLNARTGGSIVNSRHLTGQAIDFYQQGVTDILANRKKAINWIKRLPNHNYTYGNGINSNGYSVYAPYMGNALHTDVK